jgi:hypothetical protein
MTAWSAILAALALGAAAQPQASGGVTAPERTSHRYEVVCGGRRGAMVIEERFDRRVPARNVAILGFTPLAGRTEQRPGRDVVRAAARMARIDRVSWLCDQQSATLILHYLDREAFDRAVREDRPMGDPLPIQSLYLTLDSRGLRTAGLGRSAAGAAPDAQRSGTLIADVQLSEWTPPGQVALDLATGNYQLTPARPRRAVRGTPPPASRRSTLGAAQLAEIRAAADAALAEGLDRCADGRMPPEVIVSNAGTPRLVLTRGSGISSAPDDLGCWTGSAQRLHQLLERNFDSRR